MSGEKDNVREQLSAYLDRELSDAESRRVAAALESDPDLQAELDQLRRVRDVVGSLPSSQAPEGFVERVMARAERERLVQSEESSDRRSGPLRWARLLATAAVLLIAAGAGLKLFSSLVFTSPGMWDNGEPSKVGEIARDRDTPGEEPTDADGQQELSDETDAKRSGREATGGRAKNLSVEAEPARPESTDGPAPSRGSRALDFAGDDEVYRFNAFRKEHTELPAPGDAEQRVLSEGLNVDLYVSDVVRANEKVLDVLNRRGIVVEPPEGNGTASAAQWQRNYSRPRVAFANNLASEQVEIVAFVPAGEVPELLSELRETASQDNAETLKLRVRRPSSAPARTERAGEVLAEQQRDESNERVDLLRRQLQRQTALRAAGDPAVEDPSTEDVEDSPESMFVAGTVAEEYIEPLLINLLDIRAALEDLPTTEQAPETGEKAPESQPSSE